MSDPIADAAAAVEADHDEAGSGSESPGLSDPDQNVSSDPDPEIGETPQAGRRGITDRLMDPLEGSIRSDRIGELWDPDQGGANRLVLVAEEVAGLGDGLPRAAHLVLGLAEVYINHAENFQLGGGAGDGADEETDDQLTVNAGDL